MKYFIHINGQQLGPFEENELIAQNITPLTMVWSEGMESWMPAGQVAGLSHLFQNAGPQQQPPSRNLPISNHNHSNMAMAHSHPCPTLTSCGPS